MVRGPLFPVVWKAVWDCKLLAWNVPWRLGSGHGLKVVSQNLTQTYCGSHWVSPSGLMPIAAHGTSEAGTSDSKFWWVGNFSQMTEKQRVGRWAGFGIAWHAQIGFALTWLIFASKGEICFLVHLYSKPFLNVAGTRRSFCASISSTKGGRWNLTRTRLPRTSLVVPGRPGTVFSQLCSWYGVIIPLLV